MSPLSGKVIVLMNVRAGAVPESANEAAIQLRETFAIHRSHDVEVRQVDGTQITAETRRALAQSPGIIVAAGGDGTVSAVAGLVAGTETPLGIIPRGTLNHFARELNLPLDMQTAVEVITRGNIRAVDVASANGRVFVNNSSIGIYPQVVRDRDAQRQRLGRGKWWAMILATLTALRRFPVFRVRLGVEGRTVLCTTPFVFVGNNEYQISLFNIRGRNALNSGKLCLYVAHRTGRFGMFILALRALFGRLEQAKDFESACLEELWIDSGKHHLHVAFDGEVETLTPPLHYQIHPRALKVIT